MIPVMPALFQNQDSQPESGKLIRKNGTGDATTYYDDIEHLIAIMTWVSRSGAQLGKAFIHACCLQ